MSRLPKILFYTTFFDSPCDTSFFDPVVQTAYVFDKSLYEHVDAVVFHIPDLTFGTPTVADIERLVKPPKQLWVAWSMESAVNYPVLDDQQFMQRFDLEISYRRSASLWSSYFPTRTNWLEAMRRPLPPKSEKAPLVMFQSAPFNKSLRTEFASQLMQEIEIDSYGRHLNNKALVGEDRGGPTKLATISRYKFCLSLENAIEDDYVTEKFFDPLLAGVVPVYRGAPNVAEFAPGANSFINAADFSDAKDLAAYLNHLDADDAAYRRYFAWRDGPVAPAFEKGLQSRDLDPFAKLVEIVRQGLKS
jgi:hypothetical protein